MKVLLVEDDHGFRALLKRLLENKYDADVFEAINGIKGLELVKKRHPQVILLDIDMPQMDGKQFLEMLRQFDEVTPVVIMTALSEKELITELIPLGITDYILKTEPLELLTDRVQQILFNRRP